MLWGDILQQEEHTKRTADVMLGLIRGERENMMCYSWLALEVLVKWLEGRLRVGRPHRTVPHCCWSPLTGRNGKSSELRGEGMISSRSLVRSLTRAFGSPVLIVWGSRSPGEPGQGVTIGGVFKDVLCVHSSVILGQFDREDNTGNKEDAAASKTKPECVHWINDKTASYYLHTVHNVTDGFALGHLWSQRVFDPGCVLFEVSH